MTRLAAASRRARPLGATPRCCAANAGSSPTYHERPSFVDRDRLREMYRVLHRADVAARRCRSGTAATPPRSPRRPHRVPTHDLAPGGPERRDQLGQGRGHEHHDRAAHPRRGARNRRAAAPAGTCRRRTARPRATRAVGTASGSRRTRQTPKSTSATVRTASSRNHAKSCCAGVSRGSGQDAVEGGDDARPRRRDDSGRAVRGDGGRRGDGRSGRSPCPAPRCPGPAVARCTR